MTTAPLATLTDDQLVLRFRNGDDAAFSEIHRRFRAALTAFARRMLHGSGHDADDVVQDAFIRALRALRATDHEMALRAWLYMIVRNRAYDLHRSASAHRTESDERLALVSVAEADPAHRAVAREELAEVVAGIAALP